MSCVILQKIIFTSYGWAVQNLLDQLRQMQVSPHGRHQLLLMKSPNLSGWTPLQQLLQIQADDLQVVDVPHAVSYRLQGECRIFWLKIIINPTCGKSCIILHRQQGRQSGSGGGEQQTPWSKTAWCSSSPRHLSGSGRYHTLCSCGVGGSGMLSPWRALIGAWLSLW